MDLSVATAAAALLLGSSEPAESPPTQQQNFWIGMEEAEIFNPWTGKNDRVRLRAYRGDGIGSDDLIAPTLRVRPGERLNVHVDNKLPACDNPDACYNSTNIHTHGLWISPSGNSDNVMLEVQPGESFDWQFDIDEHHPAGTFWYHPHAHGNTFVQVGSGMAGALIIDGDRAPTETSPGDIDILLKDEDDPFQERIFMFQQIHYACFKDDGKIKFARGDDDTSAYMLVCDEGDVGEIRGPRPDGEWSDIGRFTSINGKVQPLLTGGRAGRFERWRMVHAGVRERVLVRLFKLADDAPDFQTVPGRQQADYIAQYCQGDPVPMWQVAIDGLTRSEVRPATEAVLYGGTRLDFVTRFETAGRYCVIHGIRDGDDPRSKPRVLAMLDVDGAVEGQGDLPSLADTMIAAAERTMPEAAQQEIRDKVIADLRDGLKLPSFVWHKTITDEEIKGTREATVNILVGPDDVSFQVNGRPFDHDRVDFALPLGSAEQWHAASLNGRHPLHIHVNPFQLVAVMDGSRRDVLDPEGEAYDPDYAGLAGQWMDTILLKDAHRAIFRTRYEKFTGDFVTHCHIMYHGDHGMMMHLRIYDPALGEASASGSHH